MSIRWGIEPSSESPSARIPVPESRITRPPSSGRTSMQDVLPPVRTVSGPGEASEPREPQNLARTSGLLGPLPEDGDPADELILLREQREADRLEVADLAVDGLDAKVPVARDAAPERMRKRQVLERDRLPCLVHGLERLGELRPAHLCLRVGSPEEPFRGLVEEDEAPLRVDQEHRARDVGSEVLGQDQGDVTMRGPRRLGHARNVHQRARSWPRLSSTAEASGFLVGPAVFKTDEGATSSLAGSIPVRLRHSIRRLREMREPG